MGFAFVLPSFAMVLVLAALYLHFEGLLFYGVGAAVIAIIARSAAKLTRMTLAKDWLLWTLFFASALVTVVRRRSAIAVSSQFRSRRRRR